MLSKEMSFNEFDRFSSQIYIAILGLIFKGI